MAIGAYQNYSTNVRKQVAMSLIMDIYMTSVMDTFLDKDDGMMLSSGEGYMKYEYMGKNK